MAKAGYKVGILDADITGPSIPKMFGAHGQLVGDEKGMYPYETKEGIKIVSINLLMEDEEAPVVWRGPVIAGAVKQFCHREPVMYRLPCSSPFRWMVSLLLHLHRNWCR